MLRSLLWLSLALRYGALLSLLLCTFFDRCLGGDGMEFFVIFVILMVVEVMQIDWHPSETTGKRKPEVFVLEQE